MPLTAYWEEFLDALRAAIVTAWPDVETNGVWESTQSAQTEYGRTGFPKAVMQILPARPSDYYPQAHAYEQPVVCWYVARDPKTGASVPFREKVKALQDTIRNAGMLVESGGLRFACLDFENFDVFEKSEGNMPFFSRDTAYLTGNIAPVFLLGDFA